MSVPTQIAQQRDALPASRRTKYFALAGIFMSTFVSMLAMNVVGTSMPRIIADIGGTQASLTWVVMATTLASAISTPIWGKLADLSSKKALLQISLTVFTLGSMCAGLAPDPGWLIAIRVFQGLGVGGLGVLGQIVLAEIISPIERGKYLGYLGAVMAVATVGGPLIGGFFTDTIGWRWNFYVVVPFAVAAFIMLQLTLRLPKATGKIRLDYAGVVVISGSFSLLLIWVTLVGGSFDWISWQSIVLVGGGLLLLTAAIVVELRAADPIVPLTLFADRTFMLAVIASVGVGVALFASIVYLGQYLQLARGRSVIESSLLSLPMMLGVLGASAIVGQLISRFGRWKSYLVGGSIVLLLGLLLMGQIRADTAYWYVGVAMLLLGCGIGLTMENLVLIVQNTARPTQLGVASSTVTFFRTLGGAAGISVMGSLLGHRVAELFARALPKLTEAQAEPSAQVRQLQQGIIPRIADLDPALRDIVETAYGHAIGDVFLSVAPVAVIALVAVAFLPNIPLGTKTNAQRRVEAVGE